MKFTICLAIVLIFAGSCSKGFSGWFVLADANDNRNSSDEDNAVPTCVKGFHGPSYILFTRDIPMGQPVNQDDEDIPLDRNVKTGFISHGFASRANDSDFFDIISAWLKYEPMNIFSVKWDEDSCSIGGSPSTERIDYYYIAVSFISKVGDMVAKFTKKLVEKYDVDLSETTLIGHSLGAHLSGFAGKEVQNLGLGKYKQIIGLDPSGRNIFEKLTCPDRLCIDDASFVVVLHTSSFPGIRESLGHVDFYFNHGICQPGCEDSHCSHGRSKEYFLESIRNNGRCMFLGRPYNLQLDTTIDKSQCQKNTCSPAGLQTIDYPARGSLYVETSAVPPYCLD